MNPRLTGIFAILIALVLRVSAHEEPTSHLELHVGNEGVNAVFTASAVDLAHDLPQVDAAMLLRPDTASASSEMIVKSLAQQMTISADGTPVAPELRAITPIPEKRDLRMELFYPWATAPETVGVKCLVFQYDPRHRTFLNVHANGKLERQEILHRYNTIVEFKTGTSQRTGSVVAQFLVSGIHHIFIGPDHILFVVGLLLLGGTVGQLAKVVTTFTIAHSITLGLATFKILTPPASVIEPIIALSIVFVGVHAFMDKSGRDPRLIFAFAFGLIHGFGFANVLQEMVLPRAALGWSLFAFNAGVELGQLCIIITVAPLLALIRHISKPAAARVVASGALAITAMGAFWFFQRVL